MIFLNYTAHLNDGNTRSYCIEFADCYNYIDKNFSTERSIDFNKFRTAYYYLCQFSGSPLSLIHPNFSREEFSNSISDFLTIYFRSYLQSKYYRLFKLSITFDDITYIIHNNNSFTQDSKIIVKLSSYSHNSDNSISLNFYKIFY